MDTFSDCSKLSRVILPSSGGTFGIGFYAFTLEGGSSPLDLYIPNENTDLTVFRGAFSGRNVTVYYSGSSNIMYQIKDIGNATSVTITPYPSTP